MRLGIISDSHGELHPNVHRLFYDVDEIIHAGDIEKEDVFIELQTIAPVTTVRGNMDRFGRLVMQREFIAASFDGKRFFIVHDLGSPLAVKPRLLHVIEGYLPHVIIFGHTHIPYSAYIQDILYFNPGSSKQGRSGAKASVGIIEIANSRVTGTIHPLE